ncbi:MAG TPA: hypothetical protein VF515_05135 [Candidatus Binatia bacterium]|jgi:hypothetical protein
MRKEEEPARFGPGHWVTMRDTGENVKVESWSAIAAAYRVRSRKGGLQFAGQDELVEICVHPEDHLGKHWSRCPAPGCGAPLTPGLALCEHCHAPICTCGRCRCPRKPARKPARKKAAPKAR